MRASSTDKCSELAMLPFSTVGALTALSAGHWDCSEQGTLGHVKAQGLARAGLPWGRMCFVLQMHHAVWLNCNCTQFALTPASEEAWIPE